MTREELDTLLAADKETEHLEFKEASKQISILGKNEGDQDKADKKSVYGYCVAIGNEGGGNLILGVKDRINQTTGKRDITGTHAIPNFQKTKELIFSFLGRKVEIEEIMTEDGNVQIVHIPQHPQGEPFNFFGRYLMRNGEHLVDMDMGTLSRIINETREDFSAQINKNISWHDLDLEAIMLLKAKWIEKKKTRDLDSLKHREVLEKLLLITDEGITNACLLLVGKPEALAEFIPCAEVFLEWRLEANKVGYDTRDIVREPYIIAHDKVWNFVNSRNTRVPFKQGFFELDIWAYDEDSVREAVLNAFAHREYSGKTEPIYLRVSPDKLSIKSAGGFLPGVSPENALDVEGQWRNRRLMEVLGIVGLVERAGIGLDRIYKASISQGKGLPDFEGTTNDCVVLNIPAKIKDVNFVYYLQKIAQSTQLQIDTVRDFIELEHIREYGQAKDRHRLDEFLKHKIVETIGTGRGTRYILAKNFYEFIGNRSEYTRKKWLSKEQQKQVLLNYLGQYGSGQMKDFKKLFEEKLSPKQIFILLNELRREFKVSFDGKPRSRTGRWSLQPKE